MIYRRLAHISDVHIRKAKRHKEYRHVFRKLYKSLREKKVDLIILTGDLVHNKTDLSPEAVKLLGDFYKNLASIAEVISIVGNHDCIISQKGRLNSLSPVVSLVKDEKINLVEKSGFEEYGNITFGVFDINDEKNFPTSIPDPDINKTYIALFHGPMHRSQANAKYTMDSKYEVEMFDEYDYAILGDIHKRQFLNDEETIAYSGSLIQQNFGEEEEKGYMIWDIQQQTTEFVPIPSDYGFRSYYLESEQLKDISNLNLPDPPRFAYIRVFVSSKDYNVTTVSDIESVLKRKYKPIGLYVKPFDKTNAKFDVDHSIEVDDITNLKTQKSLLREFLKGAGVNRKDIKEIVDVHEDYFSSCSISDIDTYKARTWKIISMKFSNVFSYGEDNEINFDSLKGITGIFSDNATGKSNLLYTILTCFFNMSSRASRKNLVDIINDNKNEAKIEVLFTVDGVEYIIRRTIKRIKKRDEEDRAKGDVYIYKIGEDGKEINLMGRKNKNNTEAYIRDLIGSFEEHSMTSFSQQFDVTNFIDYRQQNRKELLSKFLGLTVIEMLFKTVREDNLGIKRVLKQYEDNDYYEMLEEKKDQEDAVLTRIEELQQEKDHAINNIGNNDLQVEELRRELKNVKDFGDIDDAIETIGKHEFQKMTHETALNKLKVESVGYGKELAKLQGELSKYFTEDHYAKCRRELQQAKSEKNQLEKDISILENEINTKTRSIGILGEHDWFETLEECKKCTFLSDAFETREVLPLSEEQLEDKKQRLAEIEIMVNMHQAMADESRDFNECRIKIGTISYKLKNCNLQMDKCKQDIEHLEEYIKNLTKLVKEYDENEASIVHNENINNKIDALEEDNRKHREYIVEYLDKDISSLNIQYGQLNQTIESLEDSIEKLKEIERKFRLNNLLLKALSPDGMPFMIISKVIPVVNNNIRNILNDVENFDVYLDIDTYTRDLLIFIDDGVTKKRVEKGSGMEKTMAAIVIRAALSNISLLPQCNLFVIDEGFGTMDTGNLNNVNQLLVHLKNYFESVMIISHIESMKDVTDNIIAIDKDNEGFSHILMK